MLMDEETEWPFFGLEQKIDVGITCDIAPSPALCTCQFTVKVLVQYLGCFRYTFTSASYFARPFSRALNRATSSGIGWN